jgi:hypothetical protein
VGKIVEVLLDETHCFRREDSKTNLCIPIPVHRDFDSLEFICSYEPKIFADEDIARQLVEEGLEKYVPPEYRERYGNWRDYLPVLNFITLSVDCMRRVHTPPPWGDIKGMYPETNTLPKQPYPVRSAAGLVDCGERYVGCAHRHTPEQRHIISRHFSSPGFFKTPAAAGAWRAVLNVHAIVSGEVRYHLRVNGLDTV